MTVSALNKLGGLLALMMGRFDQAEGYLSRAEELVEETDAEGQAELGVIRCQMGVIAADFEGVLGHMNTVVSSRLKAGNDFTLSIALAHTAQSQVFLNQHEEARATAEEALALALLENPIGAAPDAPATAPGLSGQKRATPQSLV